MKSVPRTLTANPPDMLRLYSMKNYVIRFNFVPCFLLKTGLSPRSCSAV
uniref:Uncharacterized protein n=1 Tax=Anguilla anguilla TaxID=7936 RepID=A0A0E9WUV7_ANGAN